METSIDRTQRIKIALGMSGGVDSAVSAVLLSAAGYEVVGVTCLFFDDERSRAAAHDAAVVCGQLGIEHHVVSGVECFERDVITRFVHDYEQGLTPSPCAACNARCKIPLLIDAADEFGCEKVATGHYARVAQLTDGGRYVVKAALDTSKDQSYMLSRLSQEQLARLVLPLGGSTKVEVRIIAEDIGLTVAQKPESQDICFIEGDYRDFLRERGVSGEPGPIIDRAGVVRGKHEGLEKYTIGQRKGIGIAAPEPYYVLEKRPDTNELVVGFKEETEIDHVVVGSLNWMAFEEPEDDLECMVKLRYRSRPAPCRVHLNGKQAEIHLISPQQTTASGQFAVFYQGETVLGSGVIQSTTTTQQPTQPAPTPQPTQPAP